MGAPGEDSNAIGVDGNQNNNGAQNSGAAYVFVRTGSTWDQQAYLKASNTNASDNFGETVAISGHTIVVGAPHEASASAGINGDQSNNAFTEAGAAYVFVRSGATWAQEAYIKASNADNFDLFGTSVAVSNDTIVVGAFREDSGSTGVNGVQNSSAATNSGAAYVLSRSGSTWAQEAYLKASNTERRDAFGISVAISGDTVVVGASGEDSSATGVDGAQGNNSLLGAGAAYAFVRAGGSWAQQAYLKASNTDASDSFGEALAISGDTVIVGAFRESSSATGINGDQISNSAIGSGAAYEFVRSGTTWAQRSYLKASNTDAGDRFGAAVATTGDTIVVGAWYEESLSTGVGGNQSDNSAAEAGAAYAFKASGVVGLPYCTAVPNSTGAASLLMAAGTASASGNDLTLLATSLPPGAFGFFLTSPVQGFVMNPGGSEGNLCLGGSIGRYVGPGQIQQANASGAASLTLDLTNTPQPTGSVSINAGETWNFQGWHRDTTTSGTTSNFTNGLEVAFTM